MRPDELRDLFREKMAGSGASLHGTEVKNGLPRGSIRNVLDGHEPKVSRAAEICRALGLEFYIGPPRNVAEFPKPRGYDPAIDDADYVMVPRLPVKQAAGHGTMAPDGEKPVELLAFRREWMERNCLRPGEVSAVVVTGDSMTPTLAHGDTVLVDHQRNEARQGRIFAIRRGQDLLVKRMQNEPESGWMLTSDNEDYAPVGAGTDFRVIGEIVWRGAWLGDKRGCKKDISDLLSRIEMMARHRVDSGEVATVEEAIAAVATEMAEADVFEND